MAALIPSDPLAEQRILFEAIEQIPSLLKKVKEKGISHFSVIVPALVQYNPKLVLPLATDFFAPGQQPPERRKLIRNICRASTSLNPRQGVLLLRGVFNAVEDHFVDDLDTVENLAEMSRAASHMPLRPVAPLLQKCLSIAIALEERSCLSKNREVLFKIVKIYTYVAKSYAINSPLTVLEILEKSFQLSLQLKNEKRIGSLRRVIKSCGALKIPKVIELLDRIFERTCQLPPDYEIQVLPAFIHTYALVSPEKGVSVVDRTNAILYKTLPENFSKVLIKLAKVFSPFDRACATSLLSNPIRDLAPKDTEDTKDTDRIIKIELQIGVAKVLSPFKPLLAFAYLESALNLSFSIKEELVRFSLWDEIAKVPLNVLSEKTFRILSTSEIVRSLAILERYSPKFWRDTRTISRLYREMKSQEAAKGSDLLLLETGFLLYAAKQLNSN